VQIPALEMDEYPIYVRAGAVIPLADQMLTTKDGDWSHLTLDVYPGQGGATLYEDDTASNAYQTGAFRTTQLQNSFADGKLTLSIGMAAGAFTGPRAFVQRDWTIRMHQPEDCGPLQSVICNGEDVPFEMIAMAEKAMPFALTGGAADGDVYMIEISAPVEMAQELVFSF